jgi:hypothetical protein
VKIVAELTAEVEGSQTSTMPLEVSKTPYVPLSMLNLVFVRLDSQVTHILGDRNRKLLSPVLDDKGRGYQADIPTSFSSIEEARNSLDYVWKGYSRVREQDQLLDEMGRSASMLDFQFNVVRSVVLLRLQKWSRAFKNFFRCNPQDFDYLSQEHIHVMKLHHILIEIFLKINLAVSNYEIFWDDYYVEFRSMLEHAAEVTKLSTKSSNNVLRPVFSLDMGIILPLYLVAAKCRHPTLRRKSIALLKSTPRQEGILNSWLVGRVLERMVEIEEKNFENIECAEHIPDWARLNGVAVTFDPEGRRAYLQYLRQEHKESNMETIEELIEW